MILPVKLERHGVSSDAARNQKGGTTCSGGGERCERPGRPGESSEVASQRQGETEAKDAESRANVSLFTLAEENDPEVRSPPAERLLAVSAGERE